MIDRVRQRDGDHRAEAGAARRTSRRATCDERASSSRQVTGDVVTGGRREHQRDRVGCCLGEIGDAPPEGDGLLRRRLRVTEGESNLPAMGIQAVSHIAVGVRDMDVALPFYRDVLGMYVSADKVEEFPQGPDQPPAQRRAVYLRWVDGPHASFVVLDQQLTWEPRARPRRCSRWAATTSRSGSTTSTR